MCKVKNSQITDLLSKLRTVEKEGVSSINDEELANDLAALYYVKKEFEKYEELLKAVVVERNIPLTMIPDLELKVQVTPGNKSKAVDLIPIFKWFLDQSRIGDLLKCLSFVEKKAKEVLVEDDPAWEIIDKATEEKLSEKRIASVSKMTKQEMKEAMLRK